MIVFDLKRNPGLLQKAVEQAAVALIQGRLIIYPTDTVYGIAADATNQQAIDTLRQFKGQRGTKPISVAVSDQAMAEKFATLNEVAKNLYSQFLPGPLTIISNLSSLSSLDLAKGIASPHGTVGVRIIPHSFVAALFAHIDVPITATSANISNQPNPRSLIRWLEKTPAKKQALVDCFIDAGELPYREPSTIIDTSKEDAEIVRQGSLDLSQIASRRPSLVQSFVSHSSEETQIIAHEFCVSMLSSHVTRQTLPVIIALQGPLGAGKTVFTQGLACALGISETLRSPTYTLVKEYEFISTRHSSLVERRMLYHIDAWRLSSPEEFQDLGLNDMLKSGNIIVIEWPQRLHTLMAFLERKAKLIVIDIKTETAQRRHLTVTS